MWIWSKNVVFVLRPPAFLLSISLSWVQPTRLYQVVQSDYWVIFQLKWIVSSSLGLGIDVTSCTSVFTRQYYKHQSCFGNNVSSQPDVVLYFCFSRIFTAIYFDRLSITVLLRQLIASTRIFGAPIKMIRKNRGNG